MRPQTHDDSKPIRSLQQILDVLLDLIEFIHRHADTHGFFHDGGYFILPAREKFRNIADQDQWIVLFRIYP